MKLSELKPLKRNPRRIKSEAMKRLEESISRDPEYMIARPIICNPSGVILGGNQRYQACKNLGMKEIPDNWVRTVDWSEEKSKRFSVVDNAPEGMSGDWDMEILKLDWSTDELEGLGFDLDDVFDIEGIEPPELSSADREPFQQMSFMLHDEQVKTIREALAIAKRKGGGVTDINENSNANALCFIAEHFING